MNATTEAADECNDEIQPDATDEEQRDLAVTTRTPATAKTVQHRQFPRKRQVPARFRDYEFGRP